MKNNKFKLFILFNLPVITICFLLASCDNFFMPESKIGKVSQNYNISPINRKSELALWHLAENHESPVETLQEQVQAWLQSDTGTESRNKSSVTSVYSYSVTVENGFSSLPANRRSPDAAPERSVIPFYVFKLENHSEGTSGFAFTCGDLRIGGLLALVENGDFHDTENPFWEIFLGCLDEYIEESIAVYNSINDSDIEEALTVNNADASRSADEDPPDYKFDEVKFEKTYEQVYLKTVIGGMVLVLSSI